MATLRIMIKLPRQSIEAVAAVSVQGKECSAGELLVAHTRSYCCRQRCRRQAIACRLLFVRAIGGLAARSAPVATILPGVAAARLAAAFNCRIISAPQPFTTDNSPTLSLHTQLPLLMQFLSLHHHYHLSAALLAISPALSPNSQLPLLLQLQLYHHHYQYRWCLHHSQKGLAACSAIGDMILQDNACAMHAGTGIWQRRRAP
jgi:hypothetical protein